MVTPFDTSGEKWKNSDGGDNNKRGNHDSGGRGGTATVVVTTVEVVVVTTMGVEATTTALTTMLPMGETTEAIEEALMVGPRRIIISMVRVFDFV